MTVIEEGSEARAGAAGGRVLWLLLLVALVGAGAVGYLAGTQHSGERTLSGRAVVGQQEASIVVGGWTYGVSGSVAWTDATGNFHEDGWPDCLPLGSSPVVTFGAVPVSYRDGMSARAVVWVDCRRTG